MLEVWVHDDADEDLKDLQKRAPEVADYISALLEEIASDAKLADRLTEEDFETAEPIAFNVDPIDFHQEAGRNIWRLKTWTANGSLIYFRIIYAFDTHTRDYHVLGIVGRDICYDRKHPRTRKLIEAYKSLELGGDRSH